MRIYSFLFIALLVEALALRTTVLRKESAHRDLLSESGEKCSGSIGHLEPQLNRAKKQANAATRKENKQAYHLGETLGLTRRQVQQRISIEADQKRKEHVEAGERYKNTENKPNKAAVFIVPRGAGELDPES